MKASPRTRRYYVACLAARITAFSFLVAYALRAPSSFAADLASHVFHITPLTFVWLLLMGSMIFRFFPSRLESLGCQKEFGRRLHPTGQTPSKAEIRKANCGALWVLLSWIALNAPFLFAHWKGWLGDRFLVCMAAFYGVCDIICILFFCPFQSWMMHNRCCTTCRIYNWDYLMMCTPLMGIASWFTLAACVLAVALFLRWEITYYTRPERFFESGNESLRCSQCQEHLCRYKRALQTKTKSHH